MNDFIDDWDQATEAFRALVPEFAPRATLPYPGASVVGTPFHIDVAQIGDADAQRCVIVTAGLHGVEGIMGSAVQRHWLRTAEPTCATRVVLVHVLNPYGFTYGRRVDQDNVDLNRNFLLDGEAYIGAPEDWDRVASWLGAKGSGMFRYPRLLLTVLRYGMKPVVGAVAGGQHLDSAGLFFGGHRPSTTCELMRRHLKDWVGLATKVIHIDLHSGMGAHGALTLLASPVKGTPAAHELSARFGEDLRPRSPDVAFYRTTGAMGAWCCSHCINIDYRFIAAEFGTVPVVKTLLVLAEENWCSWHLPHDHHRTAKARAALLEVFNPISADWRKAIIQRGKEVIDRAIAPPDI